MGSIGFLGLLVWSHDMMAYLKREFKDKNFTIGREGLKLLSTFYSLNGNNMAQSAGNKKNGSSETICENAYDLFIENYNIIYKDNKFIENKDWLDWFIGFTEGDGAILEHKGRCQYVLTQKDVKVLEEVKNVFKFGKVSYFYDSDNKLKYGRYIVSDNESILLLYLLFNGNLYLKHRQTQLEKWYNVLNIAAKSWVLVNFDLENIPEISYIDKRISLDNGWLSGFTDAEGCFSIKIYKLRNVDYVKIVYILDKKNGEDILNEISILLTNKKLAKLRKTVNGNMFRIEVSCNDINKLTYKLILDYFNHYKLKTTKKDSFNIWETIMKLVLGNQPLCIEKIEEIRILRKNMNKFIIDNNPIGHANKS